MCIRDRTNATASKATVSKVVHYSDMSNAAKVYLTDFDIPINDSSEFMLLTTAGRNKAAYDTASIQVVTKNGDQTTVSTLYSFTTSDKDTKPDAKLADLFDQPKNRNGTSYSYINSSKGFKIVGTVVYSSYPQGGYTYLNLSGAYFTYYDQGGTAPSQIRHVSACTGHLYTKSGTSMTQTQEFYRHAIDYTRYSPISNTVYSSTNAMGSNQYILPVAALGGLTMGFFVTISGKVYSEENSISYY